MGQEKIGAVDEAVIKAVGAFGGGIAASGDVCGALTGAVAFISSMYSRGNLEEKEDHRMWTMSATFIKKFDDLVARYGGHDCKDIAGVDWSDREAVKQYYGNADSSRADCIRLVGEAACILGQLLEMEEAKEGKA